MRLNPMEYFRRRALTHDRPGGLDQVWNHNAKPFTWTKTADQIIDPICRYCDRVSRPFRRN
ncbi:hypothetical protein [Nonomuraea dietziae]|uniref:hypothetical protein n=1 Tax=Nonomuraea dietziae TaxID=65515 RepID=UPI003419804B